MTSRAQGRADGAHLMLRRNLPLWKPARAIEEAIGFCTEVGIAEIIWKIDPEAFNHGFTPHELIRAFIPWLEKARDALREAGILFSINPWVTLNHARRGRYSGAPPPGFHWRVGPDGEEALERACPLSDGWREWFLGAYRLFAGTKPDKLWLEDDFKTFAEDRCKLGCYCPKHLEAFSRKIGHSIDREELVERLLRPGEPEEIRAAWLDFQGEIMVGICRELEKAVHAISPGTRLGLMNSWSTDGRWWAEAIRALAGPHRPLARTSLAPYQEAPGSEWMPDNFDFFKESACLPPGTENCPELENYLYTPYSKSARTTRLQIILSQVAGNRAITMNLFNMLGDSFSEDPRTRDMLKSVKPLLDAIASLASPGGTPRGVSVPFPPRYADTAQAEPRRGFDVFRFDGEGWVVPLQGSGIPVVLNGDRAVHALTGQSARALRKEDLERLLAGGALLDGSAARVLHELGYGALIGVEPGEKIDSLSLPLAAERDDQAPDASPDDPVYMALWSVGADEHDCFHPLRLLEGATAASWLVDNDGKAVFPGMVLFENQAGGRVATHAFDLSRNAHPCFMNWRRRSQLQRVIRWLGRGRVDLIADGGAWMIPVRRDFDDYVFIAVLNVENDGWDYLELAFESDWPAGKTRFELLDESGVFGEVRPATLAADGPNVRARLDVRVPALDVKVLRVSPASGRPEKG